MAHKKLLYQILVVLVFGSLAYFTRAYDLITPLGSVFVLDLRDFCVAIGAAIGGPVAGFLIGVMAGIPAAIPAIDVTSFSVAGLFVGYFSDYFFRKKINVAYSAIFMLTGYGIAVILVAYYGLWQASPGLILRAVICTPVNIFILNNIFNAFPDILPVMKG
jgi:LytS/YehU family sensor histidine kinase